MNSVRATAGQRFLLAGVAGRQAIARQVRRAGGYFHNAILCFYVELFYG
jgi:hypothetical protein